MTSPIGGFTQIPVGPQPIQVMPPLGQGVTVTIVNQDISNIVSLGRSNNVQVNSLSGANVQPLTAITVDASTAIYAVAPAGTAQILVIPGGAQWSASPAQIAQQIALANASTPVVSQGSVSLPNLVGGVGSAQQPVNLTNVNPVTMTGLNLIGSNVAIYESYEFVLSISAGQIGSTGIGKLTLAWYNSPSDTIAIDQVVWYLPASFTNAPTLIWGHGQHRGAYLVAQVASMELVGTLPLATLNFARINGTARPYQNDWAESNGVPQELNPSSASVYSNELLQMSAVNVAASTSIERGAYLYAGKAHFHAENRGAAGVLVGDLTDAIQGLDTIWHGSIPETAAGVVDIDLILPRKPMLFSVSNSSATAAGTLYVSLVADRV